MSSKYGSSDDVPHTMKATPGKYRYAVGCCSFAALGGLYFGYDQGVSGGMVKMPSFLNDFCKDDSNYECSGSGNLPTDYENFITLYNVIFYIGCIIGGFTGGIVADKFGRRMAMCYAASTFLFGTIWVISTPGGMYGVVLSGRVLEGIGVGSSSFSAPLYASELAPKELRGALSGAMQMAVVTGLLLANCVNLAVKDLEGGWRITNGVVLFPAFIVMVFIWCLPESPRWLYKKNGYDKAVKELKRVRATDDVTEEIKAIGNEIAAENEKSATYLDCFGPEMRRRTLIAIGLQILQQATGVNPIFSYGGIIFDSVVSNPFIPLLTLSAVNFFSTIPALYWVDRFGRRTLLLIGAAGMLISHFISGSIFVTGCVEIDDGASVDCQEASGISMVVFTSTFIFFFAISWGPICWIYPAEIFPLYIRAKCMSLSTMANWSMGALMVAVVKLFPIIGISGVYFLFGSLCVVCGVFVYFLCPETKGISLEEIESLFTRIKQDSNAGIERPEHSTSGVDKFQSNSAEAITLA